MKKIFLLVMILVSACHLPGNVFKEDHCRKLAQGKLNSCQLFSVWQNSDGSSQLVTAENKYNTPLATRINSNNIKSSYTRTLVHKNHPSGSALFAGEDSLATQLDDFLSAVEELENKDYQERFAQNKDNYFIAYFSRIQLSILHEIYQYLLSIYTTFNMTHVTTLPEYLENKATQELNKKTVIINHLINVIESQANQAITTRFPSMPKHLATRMGPTMMRHDYGADLDLMVSEKELEFFKDLKVKDYYKKRRGVYQIIFGKYLKFFRNYTAYLKNDDPEYGTQFARFADQIKKIIQEKHPKAPSGNTKQLVQALRSIKTINPPLFFYEQEVLRGLKLIPTIAKDLPNDVQSVPWPQKLIKDAQTGAAIKDRFGNVISTPRAYFLDKNGDQTKSLDNADKLFINIPTADHLYSQEVKKQPQWLNSQEGVFLMLRACLGDYLALFESPLVEETVIDPCLACLVLNSAQTVNLVPDADMHKRLCKACDAFLKIKRKKVKKKEDEKAPPPPPTLSAGMDK